MYHIKSKYIDEAGQVVKATYADGTTALQFVAEDGELIATLTTNLSAYGIVAPENHIFVKNYSEGEGLAEGMDKAGIAETIGNVKFGPFDTTATFMKVLI